MTLPQLILVALFGLTALNWTIHWYTQTVTYRLFPAVAAAMSGANFVGYHRAYQAQLVWAIYLPWSFLMAASVAAVLFPPPAGAAWAWVLLALNASIGLISFALAVPVHSRIDQEERLSGADARALLDANLVRLGAASISLLICAAFVVQVLAK